MWWRECCYWWEWGQRYQNAGGVGARVNSGGGGSAADSGGVSVNIGGAGGSGIRM